MGFWSNLLKAEMFLWTIQDFCLLTNSLLAYIINNNKQIELGIIDVFTFSSLELLLRSRVTKTRQRLSTASWKPFSASTSNRVRRATKRRSNRSWKSGRQLSNSWTATWSSGSRAMIPRPAGPWIKVEWRYHNTCQVNSKILFQTFERRLFNSWRQCI